jgi:fructokinase
MNKQYKIVGIGEILWDMLPQGKVLGGAPANYAYHASELGAKGYVISAIGKDKSGDEIISQLAAFDIELRLRKVDYPTGIVKVKLSGEGIPDYEIIKNVAWDYITLIPSDIMLAQETDAVCFGSLAQRNEVSRKSINEFILNVPDKSLKIFDINLRQSFYNKKLIEDSIKLANILKINDEELIIVSELFGWIGNDENLCKKLMETFHLDVLALTCGTKGSYLFKGKEKSYMETPIVEVKDTIGAGDSFTAGLTMGLLKNKSLIECHSLAVMISAYVCTHFGAMPAYTEYYKGSFNPKLNGTLENPDNY